MYTTIAQREIKLLKEDGYVVVGYCRKSNLGKTDNLIHILQRTVNNLRRGHPTIKVTVPRCGCIHLICASTVLLHRQGIWDHCLPYLHMASFSNNDSTKCYRMDCVIWQIMIGVFIHTLVTKRSFPSEPNRVICLSRHPCDLIRLMALVLGQQLLISIYKTKRILFYALTGRLSNGIFFHVKHEYIINTHE
jgi:hypothetical protein